MPPNSLPKTAPLAARRASTPPRVPATRSGQSPGWLRPKTAGTPQFSTRVGGSYERREWKQKLHDRLAVRAATIDPGPAGLKVALTTGPGRNWANLWKPLIDAFGPVLGEDL